MTRVQVATADRTVPSPREESFAAVLRAAQVGAPWALERLWQRLSGPVAGYLRTQGATEADDLVSEVFLGVFSRLAEFEGDEARFRSWVFTIAHHKLVDDRRRRARRPDPEPLTEDSPAPRGDAETDALARLGAASTDELIRSLVPDQRDVLLLRIIGDLTVEQVARALGKTPGAVKQLQRRGLAALRKNLAGEAYPSAALGRSRD